jgi:tRNA (guanosine-2'-O-)-methyltransferase
MFPFSENLEVSPDLRVHFEKVHKKLFPLLTSERAKRIQHVCRERNFDNVVVLEGIYDRGNASAVMRSAEAFGLGQIHMIEKDEKFKESQRTTAGADKWLEVKKWKSTADCVKELKHQGKQIVVTHLDATSVPITEVDFSKPSALVLGNEKDGASKEMIAAADVRVIIPMLGFVQSFNISVAGALSFYQIYLDRQKRLQKNTSINAEQIKILEAVYAMRTLDSAASILSQ